MPKLLQANTVHSITIALFTVNSIIQTRVYIAHCCHKVNYFVLFMKHSVLFLLIEKIYLPVNLQSIIY